MKYATGTWEISRGLMFARNKRIARGLCMKMPASKDIKFGSAVTMAFMLHGLDIIFVNSSNKVVDKVTLRPWKFTYIPKDKCIHIIESTIGKFKDIKIGDRIEIKL